MKNKSFTVYGFNYPISRHRTKELAKKSIDKRVKTLRVAASKTVGTPITFNFEVKRGKKVIYRHGGYA